MCGDLVLAFAYLVEIGVSILISNRVSPSHICCYIVVSFFNTWSAVGGGGLRDTADCRGDLLDARVVVIQRYTMWGRGGCGEKYLGW